MTINGIDIEKDDKIITCSDARTCFRSYCPQWKVFIEENGYNWREVVRHGIKASDLLKTNDAQALKLVEWKYNVGR